jgi:putative SOS response-associated peptidase YedK
MCGRYVSPDDAAIEREFNLVHSPGFVLPASFNASPSQLLPVVRCVEGVRVLSLMRWGLVPFFAKGVPGPYSTINARIETIETSASYRGPWKRGQRCIVPAVGFYEWHLNDDGKKQPFYITLNDQDVFGFAGLWDSSTGADGVAVESCTIVTMPANKLMTEIHSVKHRMPAILSIEDRETWLKGSPEAAFAVIKQYPDTHMVATPVSTRVNKPQNNDASLIEAIP